MDPITLKIGENMSSNILNNNNLLMIIQRIIFLLKSSDYNR